jgi:NAD(P)-dependent dehydrogenase (short-subunit alcohol dehydrogenase family)
VGAYAATKFGLVGLNEALMKELAPQGIKVTAICPSWVWLVIRCFRRAL